MEITRGDLLRLCPNAREDILQGILTNQKILIKQYEINTPLRWCHWIAQVSAETGGLQTLEENLNYSAGRLLAVWPNRFRTLAEARPYANNPEALAEKVYMGRYGNTAPGDGWTYRGRGLKMLTFKDNYRAAQRETGIPLVERPELAAAFPTTVQIAGWYWDWKNILPVADRDDLEGVTRLVNGGLIGVDHRSAALSKAKSIWMPGQAPARKPDEQPVLSENLATSEPDSWVLTLQKCLNNVRPSSTSPRVVEDGRFGPSTTEAVIAFQRSSGLVQDGIVGPRTWAALAAAKLTPSAPPAPPVLVDEPIDEPIDEPVPEIPPLPAPQVEQTRAGEEPRRSLLDWLMSIFTRRN